jgi:CBS domain-containing protein
MSSGEPIQRVRIYLDERDMSAGQALYIAVLERLRHEGATGATALRGAGGFGPSHRARATGFVSVTDAQPIVIEWVDRVERIARVLPTIDDLIGDALVTIEDLRAYRARLRSSGPFGGQVVGDVMRRDVTTATPDMALPDAIALMLERGLDALPVIDAERRPRALISTDDLVRRAGLPVPLRILGALSADERQEMLGALRAATLAELIVEEPRTAYIQAAVPQVVGTMIEWGLDALPVIDRDARLVGMIGVEQALRSSAAPSGEDEAIRDAEPAPPVRLLMQTSVPTVAAAAPATSALQLLLGAPERFLVVVDAGVPIGALDDAGLLGVLEEPLRQAWLQALRNPAAARLEGIASELTAAQIAAPAATIPELTTQFDAITSMLEQNQARLLVVDGQARLVGLIGRRGMLRALAQASMG